MGILCNLRLLRRAGTEVKREVAIVGIVGNVGNVGNLGKEAGKEGHKNSFRGAQKVSIFPISVLG
jgi:hypothetical protein